MVARPEIQLVHLPSFVSAPPGRAPRQRAPTSLAAQTALARTFTLGLVRPVRLLPLRRRHTGGKRAPQVKLLRTRVRPVLGHRTRRLRPGAPVGFSGSKAR